MQQNATQVISTLGNVPQYGPRRVQCLMKKLNLGVRGFAFVLNVNPVTVRHWLVGTSAPGNASRRMMQVLEEVPEVLNQLAQKTGGRTYPH